jgi:iron complex transport system substrate-binding protein
LCLALSALTTGAPVAATAGVAVTDDRGVTVRLEAPASRVIALYGAFNEILADLGREDVIAARTAADKLPQSILDKPSIGTHLRPNAELILGIGPDLVLQLGGRAEALDSVRFLEERGLTVAVFDLENFDDLFSVIERLGVLTGSEAGARERVQAMRADLDAVAAATAGPVPRIFFEVRSPNLLTAGQGSIVSEVISRAGGRNCVEAPDKLVRLGEEELLRLAPDIYLMQRGPMNPCPEPLDRRPLLRTLGCLDSGQVFEVDQGMFSRPGPRSVEAVRILATIISNWKTEDRP